jgi:dihydroorotase
MSEQVDLIVRNGTVVSSAGRSEADVAIRDGRFAAIEPRGQLDATATNEIDAAGRFVLPGVIDGHVHFREPGFEYKEDWLTGSRAAVMGGVTTVLDMPNTNPQTSTPEGARVKQALAEAKSYCDFGFIGLLVSENVDQLRPMAEAGLVVGFKAFLGITIGAIPAPHDGAVLDGMREIQSLGLRLGFHAENNDIMANEIRKLQAAGRTDPMAHVESRPSLAEVESIQRMGLFARETGCKVHIFHLSSRPGLEMIDEWRAKGVDYTCETGAHYCFLTSADMATLGPILRMNPPVRESGHGDALVEGLADGRVTCIATDHSPHTHEEKERPDIWQAISGFAGVETSVRLFLTYGVNAGRLSLEQFVRASSEGPAKTWHLWPRKGAIAVGSDADLTIIDLAQEGVIREDELHGKNNINPFEGHATRGAAVGTIVRGQVQMLDGKLVGESGIGRLQAPVVPVGARG